MDKRELQELLSQSYKQENWKKIVSFVFPNVSILSTPKEFPISNDKIKTFRQLGNVRLNDGKNLALFELLLSDTVNIQRNRVELNNEISKYIDQEQIHGVLSVFEQGTDDYRFTFSARSTEFDEHESDFVQKKTDTKRYTYVLGKNESCKTPAERFFKLSEKKSDVDINAIQNAFSVEQLSKEFFEKYKKQFDKFWRFIASNDEYKKLFLANESEKKELKIRDFTKKLLGRIVFLHFLQKKGWMGCTAGIKEWEDGDKQFMQTLFENYSNQTEFHSKCLSELFYNTLNKRRTDDIFVCDGLEGVLSKSKVPYLNGGLFDSDEDITRRIDFPASYFQELFDFFGQYNFTIDENDPNDHEVGIDPEMLGHIFENLLEDNKDKGAFYTPKVIVQYMCQESIIEYINTKINESESPEIKSAIIDLIRNKLAEKCSDLDLVQTISKALFEVKICDPAIGSGAFPMGILNVIYSAIEELYFIQPDSVSTIWNISDMEWQPHLVKKNIIQHSIYGVDLESGAVDIARLRFWLALVVDEIEPLPLPNLDYKIMQGNSLLESFEGIDLSQISDASAYEQVYETEQIDMFSGEAKKSVSISLSFEDIKSLMDEYFNANDPDTKKAIHKKIDDQVLNHIRFTLLQHKQSLLTKKTPLERKLKLDEASATTWQQKEKIRTLSKQAKELAKINTELELFNEKEIKLAQLSNSNERPFFLWHLFFKEVFEEGGFDIVIGNPPYVDSETMVLNNPIERELYKTIYETATGNWDLFIIFIEKGVKLCNDKGVFSYIIPNKLLGAKYSFKLREFLQHFSIFEIRDYSRLNVFSEASVYPIVLNLSKNESHKKVDLSIINTNYQVSSTKEIQYNIFKKDLLWDKYFNEDNIVNLMLKLILNKKLNELKNFTILGSATVAEAYLIKEKIIDAPSDNVLNDFSKFINTGTIDKFQSLWGIKNTQYIKSAYCYPVILKTDIEEINNTRLIQTNSPKIIIAGMSLEIEAYFDLKSEFLAGKSTTIIIEENSDVLELGWLLAILNSKICSFYLQINYHSLKMAGGYLNIGNEILGNLPIPQVEVSQKVELHKLVNNIINSKCSYSLDDDNCIKLEVYVAKLYNLSFEEFLLIDSNFKNIISEEYFNNCMS